MASNIESEYFHKSRLSQRILKLPDELRIILHKFSEAKLFEEEGNLIAERNIALPNRENLDRILFEPRHFSE